MLPTFASKFAAGTDMSNIPRTNAQDSRFESKDFNVKSSTTDMLQSAQRHICGLLYWLLCWLCTIHWITAKFLTYLLSQKQVLGTPHEERREAVICKYDHLEGEIQPGVTEQREARGRLRRADEAKVNALKSEAMLGLVRGEMREWEKEAHENQWGRLSREAHRVNLNTREMREDRMRKVSAE